jgi:predicted ATPase
MAESPERFAQLLTEAIRHIRRREGKMISAIQDELGYELGREGGTAIEYWRKGHIPVKAAEVAALAGLLVRRGKLDRSWLEEFLASAGYLEPQALCQELFSASTPLPSHSQSLTQASSAASSHNLPAQSTTFIGRREELDQIEQRLTGADVRLLTILGPGGMGKTRLAIEAAARAAPAFPDGVWFVPLSPLQEPERLASAILEALNVPANAEDLVGSLSHFLRQKRLLLVLDNFEQLVAAAADLSRILSTAPWVKLLVTSRERLNLQEEWLSSLQSLTFPEGEGEKRSAGTYSALDLFVERMQQVQSGFSLAGENWNWAVRICRLVGGMPLGLELAASWGELLSCRQIAEEIERSLEFLESDARNLADRHRSMRAVFESSWRLLSPDEQAILRKLSIFRAGFEREAAQVVAGASLPILLGLVRKSLLHRNEDGRFEIHELLRQFAGQKLAEASEEKTVAAAHAVYYLSFLHQQYDYADGYYFSIEALDIVNREIENIRRAWYWAVDHLDLDLIGQAIGGLNRFAHLGGWIRQAHVDIQAALQRLAEVWPEAQLAEADNSTHPQILTTWGSLLIAYSECQRSILHWEESLHSARRGLAYLRQAGHTDSALLVSALEVASQIAIQSGEYEQSIAFIEEGLAVVDQKGYQRWACSFRNSRATMALYQGHYLEAHRYYSQAIDLAAADGIGLVEGWAQIHLCVTDCVLGEYEGARRAIARAQELADTLDHHLLHCACAAEGAALLLLTEDPHSATALIERLRQAASRYEESSGRSDFAKWYYAEYFRHTGDYQKAYDLWKENLHAWRIQNRAADQANMAHSLTVLLFDMGDLDSAQEQAQEAIALYNAIDQILGRAAAQTTLAEIELVSGRANRDETYACLRQAALESHRIGAKPTTLHSLYVLSKLLATDDAKEQRQALELLGLILAHPSTTWKTRQKAKQLLALLAAELPTVLSKDVYHRACVLDLDRAVGGLQATQTDLDFLS